MLKLSATAKINWALDVKFKRDDGYHELDMLMQSIELADELTLEMADDVHLTVLNHQPCAVDDNLVMRAARLIKGEFDVQYGVNMTLNKFIPTEAGLGGGSADAAATLIGLNKLWKLGLSRAQLAAIGLKLGADVPFCVIGGLCRAQGIGERLTPIKVKNHCQLLLIKPDGGLSTKQVFSAWKSDALEASSDMDNAIAAIKNSRWHELCKYSNNSLQNISQAFNPQIAVAVGELYANGAAFSAMSGSGPTVFGVFSNDTDCDIALSKLTDKYTVIRTCTCGGIKNEEF